ncbi:MAG: hypothetical protein WAS49_17430 [Candidatus Dechloromonas phosphoritropha]
MRQLMRQQAFVQVGTVQFVFARRAQSLDRQWADRCGVDPRSRGSTVGQAHDLIGDAAGFPFVDVAGIADGEFGLQQRRSLTAPRGDITRIPSMRIRRCRHDARMRFATGLHIRCVALSGDYAMLASS